MCTITLAPTNSSHHSRTFSTGFGHAPPPTVQVEDCCKDLTNEKSYYQRHRICEVHLKTLSIEMHGRPSRFCQQCARFQPLTDFEGSKR